VSNRNNVMLVAALLVAMASSLPGPASAGAWTRDFLDSYIKAAADFYKTAGYVDPQTGEEYEDDFFGQQYSFYGELGLIPVWPVQVSLLLPLTIGRRSFTSTQFADDGRAHATAIHPGDLRAGLQVAVLRRALQLSLQAEFKIPLYANDEVGLTMGSYREFFPLPGDGQVDVTARLLVGASLPRNIGWIEGGIGYRARTEAFIGWDTDIAFVDGVPFEFRAGFTTGPFTGIVAVDGMKNVKADEYTREGVAIGGGALLALGRGVSLEARLQGEVWTHNAPQGVSFGLGLSLQRPSGSWTWRGRTRTDGNEAKQ